MTKKTFGAVKLMCELRDRLSRELEQMTSEERVLHIRNRAASTDLGKQIGEDEGEAAQQTDAADRSSPGR